jgi:peptidyl-prolyl cis-trans isomerase C
MSTSTSTSGGCGSGACACASGASAMAVAAPTINGIALYEAGQQPPAEAVQELAYAELLRQEAVKAGLLPRHKGLTAPDLNASGTTTQTRPSSWWVRHCTYATFCLP